MEQGFSLHEMLGMATRGDFYGQGISRLLNEQMWALSGIELEVWI